VQEVLASRRLGVIAAAQAQASALAERPLAARTRALLGEFQQACKRRLMDPALVGDRRLLAEVLGQILVTYVRQPKPDHHLLAAADAVLTTAGVNPPVLLLLGHQRQMVLPIPRVASHWTDLAETYVKAGFEETLPDLWGAEPQWLITLDEGHEALATALETASADVDTAALDAFISWALNDVRSQRTRGVRGAHAYVVIAEPRLRDAGLERAYFLSETNDHAVVRCDWVDERRMALRLPRANRAWEPWAAMPGGRLLAAYLAGAYRDMVVRLTVEPYLEAEDDPSAQGERSSWPGIRLVQLHPIGYIPARQRTGGRQGPRHESLAPHGVAWYIRRLQPGQKASADARASAELVQMPVPLGYTFVNSHVSPRSADVRQAATELRSTVGLSALRAILQATSREREAMSADSAS
jgi:hypothetical protein